jgi:hypothetical protein
MTGKSVDCVIASEAKQSSAISGCTKLDCFVAALLAMTREKALGIQLAAAPE